VEVQRLAPVYNKYEHFYFTFKSGLTAEIEKNVRVRSIPNIVRRNPLSWFVGALLSGYIAIVERPDVVITTGAGIVVFFCIFAKALGAKLVFIESIARTERPTLTARFLYPFTDMFIVQCPALLNYFPRAKFLGRLF
jgi:beta-1,4-N-acetylglucosaminyltransferase